MGLAIASLNYSNVCLAEFPAKACDLSRLVPKDCKAFDDFEEAVLFGHSRTVAPGNSQQQQGLDNLNPDKIPACREEVGQSPIPSGGAVGIS